MRLKPGEHNVRPREQLRNRGCDIGETLGVDHRRAAGQTMRTMAGIASGLDKLNLQVVVVVLAGRQRCDGVIGTLGELLELVGVCLGPDRCSSTDQGRLLGLRQPLWSPSDVQRVLITANFCQRRIR